MGESNKNWPRDWTAVEVQGVSSGLVIYEKKYFANGGVARITFHNEIRPGINALKDIMGRELRILLSEANYDPSIGVVVITSYGDKSFLAGGDVSWEAAGGLVEQIELGLADSQASMRRCRKPIICAVKGYCIASGNHIAYFCDFTIAADNAVFGQTGPRVGSPADGHIVSYLIRVVGAKKAREMWMLCRRYNAQEALQMGLVNAVVPLDKLDEEVDKWCEEILEKSPMCIEILKAAFDAEFDYMRGTLGREQVAMAPGFLEGEEAKEAQTGFLEKRPPRWWKFRGMSSPEERGFSK